MTSAAGNTTSGTPLDTPEYDIVRSARCPLDPAPAMRARQAEGPLVRIRLWDGTLAWLVTGWEEHRALMSDPRVSVDPFRPGAPKLSPGEVKVIDALKKEGKRSTGTSFILMDDPEHARLRRMVTSAFTIKRVEALRPPTQKITDDLIDTMLAGPKPVDLVEALALPVPSLVISNLLGVPYDDHEFFQANSKT
ncbi:cytochrome P450, partial [Streptomyces sp. 2MCAF27]